MATSEFEKLERRYAENPQGLTFAPLAEVHRKNGNIPRALELLRAGLELHPNYIPASIVLGRCHWDAGDLPAAEAAFSHVLRLDDENVIALKSLADINERLERFTDAQRWLNRLISVDRSNEEARQQLARLQNSKQPPGSAARQPELRTAEPEAQPAGAAPAPSPASAAARGSVSPEPPPKKEAPAAEAPLDLTAAIAEPAAESKSPALEFIDTSEPVNPGTGSSGRAVKPPVGSSPAPVEGLISQEFVPPKDTVFRSHPELAQEFASADDSLENVEVEMIEEVELRSSGASEFRVPNAAEEFLDLAASVLGPPTEAPPPSPQIDLPEAPRVAQSEPAAAQPKPPRPAPPEPTPATPPSGPKRQSYSARDTKGQSVAAFFQVMLAARPADGAGGASGQSATQPASAGSVDQAGKDPTLVAFGGAPANSPADEVSFDDFFGAATAGSNPSPQPSDPGKEDLDQFQSWLQNLKR
jgi:hypothetical protein